MMRVAMESAKLGATSRFVVHNAVRSFGGRAYEEPNERRYWRPDVPDAPIVSDRAA
jgi:hypothetical protein